MPVKKAPAKKVCSPKTDIHMQQNETYSRPPPSVSSRCIAKIQVDKSSHPMSSPRCFAISLSMYTQAEAKDDGGEKKPKGAGGESTWVEPTTVIVKPEGQLQLSEKELDTEHTRLMSAKDPVAPQNLIRFNFKERQYKLDATVDQTACHFEMEGNLLHRDTEDGKRIVAEQENKRIQEERAKEMGAMTGVDVGDGGEPKKLRNQFNYSERASQTFNHPPRGVYDISY